MCDPLSKNNQPSGGNGNGSTGKYNNQRSKGNGSKSWKNHCCWKFNKGKCNSPDCEFDHRCTYCGKWGHGFHVCRKRLAKLAAKPASGGGGTHAHGGAAHSSGAAK